jgi:DNA-binding NarL/FixJ family response regulator
VRARISTHGGKLYVEIPMVVRLPIQLEALEFSVDTLIQKMRLNRSEKQVLAGILADKQDKEIAADVHLSLSTTKWYVSRLLKKFSVHRRSELVTVCNGHAGR